MNLFDSMHAEILTWCQQKINATSSSQLLKQWEHCSELQGNYVKK